MEFLIICYIACVITKIMMHKFTFDIDYLIDSLFISFGATLGWFLSTYFLEKKKK